MWWSVRAIDLAATLTMVAVVGGGGVLAVTGPLSASGAPAPRPAAYPSAPPATGPTESRQEPSPTPADDHPRPSTSRTGEEAPTSPAPVRQPPRLPETPQPLPVQPLRVQPPPAATVPLPGPAVLAGVAPPAAPGAGSTGGAGGAAGAVPEGNDVPTSPSAVDLVVSSFNVLGTSHTRHGERGFAPGPVRTRWAAELISDRDVDIVGLQELQRDQMHVIMGALGGYEIFPGPSMERHASVNSIMWRTDTWSAVQTSTIGIPYFKGAIYPMPYIRLRHRDTGREVWVANFHNPASTKRAGNNYRWRVEARRRQIALANKLYGESGVPVIFTGDMNEREDYFCPVVSATALEASNGGTASASHCDPPPNPRIDWIFGTPEIDWVSSVADRSALVQRTTDHPMVVARGRLGVR